MGGPKRSHLEQELMCWNPGVRPQSMWYSIFKKMWKQGSELVLSQPQWFWSCRIIRLGIRWGWERGQSIFHYNISRGFQSNGYGRREAFKKKNGAYKWLSNISVFTFYLEKNIVYILAEKSGYLNNLSNFFPYGKCRVVTSPSFSRKGYVLVSINRKAPKIGKTAKDASENIAPGIQRPGFGSSFATCYLYNIRCISSSFPENLIFPCVQWWVK